MPQRNVVKTFDSDSYYHVYSRGVSGQKIFVNDTDYSAFLNLFKRYLSKKPAFDNIRRPFPHLRSSVELLAYCLMPTHFHLLVYNKKIDGVTQLMRGVTTSYSMYFNKKLKRRGRLFESTYKASPINNDAYLWHISRYIHLNPQDIGQDYSIFPYSSFGFYLGQKQAEWINPARILNIHGDEFNDYAKFAKDYEAMRADFQHLKHQLANS